MGAACSFRCRRCCCRSKRKAQVHVDYSEHAGRYAIGAPDVSSSAGHLPEMDEADAQEDMHANAGSGFDRQRAARERHKAMQAMMQAQEQDAPEAHQKTADGFSMW